MQSTIPLLQTKPIDPGAGELFGGAASCLLILLLGGMLIPLRGHVQNADIALILALPVLLGGLLGGRKAGLASAFVATLTFDFVFTQPYLSLRIASRNDIVTALILGAVGLAAAECGIWIRRSRNDVRQARSELEQLLRLGAAAVTDVFDSTNDSANDSTGDGLVGLACQELSSLFGGEHCRFESSTNPDLPHLTPRGALVGAPLVHWGDMLLPVGDVGIDVAARGTIYGQLIIEAHQGCRAPLEKRSVAVGLANELGLALAGRT